MRLLIKCTPDEAETVHTYFAEQIEAIEALINDAHGRFCDLVENYEWSSFTPEQRVTLKHWHVGIQNAKHSLRAPNGI